MRELRPELQALINSGHCNWATAIDIILTSGTQLHLSSSELFIDRFGVLRNYLAKLRAEDIRSLEMSLDVESDQIEFAAANTDMVIGRALTSNVRELDGARATRGVIFIDTNLDFSEGQHIYDATLPGELSSSEVTDEAVSFSLISDVDSVVVSGRTIASEFQWRQPINTIPEFDPNDNPGGDLDPNDFPGRRGRYGEMGPMIAMNVGY